MGSVTATDSAMDSATDSATAMDLDSVMATGSVMDLAMGLGDGVAHRFAPSGVGTNCPYVFVFLCPPVPFGHR